ncbi:BQ2448_1307 [Microbotryum intermedium]|uniref:BQ2448_1307 protein n=1 Tax=Microbotryum intermedium TaxID=269621 RepID=A0A238FD26_9BASI|nr:BQ2448_1307 [Microbotryum intermedium]
MARKSTATSSVASSSQSIGPCQTLLSAYFPKSSPTPTPTPPPSSAETRNREATVANGVRRPAAAAAAAPAASSSSAPSSPSNSTFKIQSNTKPQNGSKSSTNSKREDQRRSQSVTHNPSPTILRAALRATDW